MLNFVYTWNRIADKFAKVPAPATRCFTDGSSVTVNFQRSKTDKTSCTGDVVHKTPDGKETSAPLFVMGDQMGERALFNKQAAASASGQDKIFSDIESCIQNNRPFMAHDL